MLKRQLFIGSSSEASKDGALDKLTQGLKKKLPAIEVKPWTETPWKNLQSALASLTSSIRDFHYAVFLFYPDDVIEIRSERKYITRDNVLFEFGLFLSALGTDRTFVVTPEEKSIKPEKLPFQLLSDVAGVFRSGSFSHQVVRPRGSLVSRRQRFKFSIDEIVKNVCTEEAKFLTVSMDDAQKELTSRAQKLIGLAKSPSIREEVLVSHLRDELYYLLKYRAIFRESTVGDAIHDLLIMLDDFADICDTWQLCREQTHAKDVKEVWVFAECPLEFIPSHQTEALKKLRDVILDNLKNGVVYRYFVHDEFDIDRIQSFCKGNTKLLSNIEVNHVEPRLFKTFFTLHLMQNDSMRGFMSAVSPSRDDILIEVKSTHVERLHERLQLLRGVEANGDFSRVTRFHRHLGMQKH